MGAVFSVIAGKMRKSHFVYKVNGMPCLFGDRHSRMVMPR